MSGISSQFPQIGSDLAAFMTNVQPFIDGASSISPAMFSGVQALTGRDIAADEGRACAGYCVLVHG